jgi:HK97 family phage major capsid protein
MVKINELRAGKAEAMASLNALLNTQAEAKSALTALLRATTPDEAAITAARAAVPADAKIKNAREAHQLAEEAFSAEEERLRLEDAAAVLNPTGRTTTEVGKDRATAKPWHTEAEAAADKDQAFIAGLGRWAMAAARAGAGKGMDARLIPAVMGAATGQNESDGGLGGYAVPVEYAPGIEKNMFDTGEILSRVDDRVISGNAITYLVMNETSRVDGSRQGGVLGYWLDEAGTKTPSTMLLARLEMKLRKVAAVGYMTDELMDDAPALGQELQQAMSRELQFQVENKIWRGLGAATPLGFTVAPCFITVAAEGGQAAATILSENLVKMWARLPPGSQKSAVWLINVDTQAQLDFLSIPAGTAALEPRFVNYSPAGILTIKGRPVVPVEYAETLGTAGDIVLADLAQYRLIRKASGIQTASSIHVAFLTDQTAFRAVYRVDGQPVPRAPITPFKGTNTLSPFVGLATRA